jgi:hypothetical protein
MDAIELRTTCHVATVMQKSVLFSTLLEELDEAKFGTEGSGLLQGVIVLGELYQGCRSFWDTLRDSNYVRSIANFIVTEVQELNDQDK